MSNELVVIEKSNALAVLSNKQGVEKLIDDVRQRVMSMEGGSLDTAKGRKAIRSNAFKATKAKTAISDEFIKPLIESITQKIQPDLDSIQALKDNQKVLNAGLDKIRKDVNAEVQAIDDAIKAEKERIEAEELAKKVAEEIERDHEMALLMDAEFNRELADKLAEEMRLEQERLAQLEKERVERDARIAQEAREELIRAAKEREDRIKREAQETAAKAEQERFELIEREEQANRNAIAAEERAKAQAEEAERQRVIAEEKAKQDAIDAENKRLADIEKAKRDAEAKAEKDRIEEVKRQEDEAKRIEEEKAQREADEAHASMVLTQTKESIMALGLSEEDAKKVTLALKNGKVANVGRIQF